MGNTPAGAGCTNGQPGTTYVQPDQPKTTSISEQGEQGDVLRLPPPDANAKVTKLDLSGGSKDLTEELGPLVINKDGTTARITNWDTMTPEERERTVRILARRNRQRMAKLKEDL